jgi:hypothetical protein
MPLAPQIPATSSQNPSESGTGRALYALLLCTGLAGRLAFAIIAGNHLTTPFSGGGDTKNYVTLARNVLAGDGFAYAHMPTALRPPLYPYLLAGLMWIAPEHWLAALHTLQFLGGLMTAWLCGRLANRWFGAASGRAALLLALFLPTLIFFTGEVLTESTAALLTILFLLYLDQAMRSGSLSGLVCVGVFSGLAALNRFNAVAQGPVAAAAVFFCLPGTPIEKNIGRLLGHGERWRRALTVAAALAVVTAPWLVRTTAVFHGRAIYSTHSGFAAVEGVLMPLGRTQPGETPAIENALGWGNWEVESNDPRRVALGPESDLNNQAWRLAFRLWREHRWELVPVAAEKISAFWLSTDQILYTRSLSPRNRLMRWAGVAVYWGCLALAITGWLRLRSLQPGIAYALLFYALVLTALHVPLTMNTRLRSPLIDPLLAALAGGGWLSVAPRLSGLVAPASPKH